MKAFTVEPFVSSYTRIWTVNMVIFAIYINTYSNIWNANEWYFFYLSLFVVMFIFVMFHVCTYFNSFRTLVRITNNWKVERSRVMHIFWMNLKSFLVIMIHMLSQFIYAHWYFPSDDFFSNICPYVCQEGFKGNPTCAHHSGAYCTHICMYNFFWCRT